MKLALTTFGLILTMALGAHTPPSDIAIDFISNLTSTPGIFMDGYCPTDMNNDGGTTDTDILIVGFYLGTETTLGCEEGDFDEDGKCTVHDFRTVLSQIGFVCP
jgi:hypothetical protein